VPDFFFVVFEMGSRWLGTTILLISASPEARISGMSTGTWREKYFYKGLS
jgi:hypothetical protein